MKLVHGIMCIDIDSAISMAHDNGPIHISWGFNHHLLQGLHECHQAFPCCPHPTGTANPVVSIWILDKRTMAEGGASPAEIEAAAETARRDASALARLKHPAVIKACPTAMFDTEGNLNFLPHYWLANRRRSCCLDSRPCWNFFSFYSLSITCATGGVRADSAGVAASS